jgi:hypothetical protein
VAELSELLLRQLLPLLMMLLVVSGLLGLVDWTHSGQLFGRGLLLVLAVGCGTVVYGFGCLMCRVPESAETWKLLQRKLFRRSA